MITTMFLPGATKLTLTGTGRERFLSAVAAFFLETARWPKVRDVERILERRGDRVNAHKEAKRLCGSLGRMRGDRIVLTVRGLHRVKPKNPVLQGFSGGLDLALERFQSDDWSTEPALSSDELAQKASLGRKQAKCVLALMASEGLVVPVEDGTSSTIAANVRRFRSVETIPEYIAERSSVNRRRCIGRVAAGRGRFLSALFNRRAATTVLLSAAGILLAALVLWLGSHLFPSADGQQQRPQVPPNSRAPERPSDKRAAGSRQAQERYSRRSAAARSGG